MKKLFTLLAFLSCFLGANAKEFVDAEVDFSKYTDISEVKFASWGGSESARARLSIQDGCLHFSSSEATDPSWDCQFFPIGGVEAEVGVTYTLHFKVKGDHAGNVSMLGFGQTPYGQFAITTDWVEGTVDYECTEANGNILMQCGDWVGTWDIAYLKITHEGKEEKPVQWENILKNGDASEAWANPNAQTVDNKYDGEGAEEVCAYSKEFGVNDNNPHAATIENGEFVCRTQIVDPVLTWEEDGEQWGTPHSAGDPKPDNTWQNQFWINFPRPMKEGEQFKVTFKYKASEAARVTTQDHKAPGEYLGGGSYGELNFTTEWQNYEKQVTAAAGVQSIAFNLGEDKQYEKDIVFYFDDITISTMVLDKGFFVASTNTGTGLVDYDLDNAVQFEGEDPEWTATVGTVGKQDTWVDEVMISTVRGNDKAFKAATLKVTGTVVKSDPTEWLPYSEGANQKIKLPAAGVWKIIIATDDKVMSFEQLEGETIVEKELVDVVTNPEVFVVKAGMKAETGNAWDNQFFITANRVLNADEETVVEFDYVATKEAKVSSQSHAQPGQYRGGAIGDVNFTTEEQHFRYEFVIPKHDNADIQTIAFNLSEIVDANEYTFKNVKWYLKNETEGKTYENLINETGTANFSWVENPLYSVIGTIEGNWDSDKDMTKGEGGIYTAVFENVNAGNYEFKIRVNHDWTVNFGVDGAQDGANLTVSVPTDGSTITVTFDPATKTITATVGDASGIINVKEDAVKANDAIFNLAGQRVSKDYKGIVVKNGKKYITK